MVFTGHHSRASIAPSTSTSTCPGRRSSTRPLSGRPLKPWARSTRSPVRMRPVVVSWVGTGTSDSCCSGPAPTQPGAGPLSWGWAAGCRPRSLRSAGGGGKSSASTRNSKHFSREQTWHARCFARARLYGSEAGLAPQGVADLVAERVEGGAEIREDRQLALVEGQEPDQHVGQHRDL